MVENEELYKDILRTKNIIENYNFFDAMLNDDIKNEFAVVGKKSYECLMKKTEESCKMHIPVVLGSPTMSNIYDPKRESMVRLRYKRCLCCGKIMTYDIDSPLEINAENYQAEYNSSHTGLEMKYLNILNEFMECARKFKTFDIAINELKNRLENNLIHDNCENGRLIIKK